MVLSDDTPVRLLIATDVASEGVTLHYQCHLLIHYELPWNPNRLEQRNGRLDRYGQPEKTVNLGSKQIYVYKDLKVTFVNGKVSDVQ